MSSYFVLRKVGLYLFSQDWIDLRFAFLFERLSGYIYLFYISYWRFSGDYVRYGFFLYEVYSLVIEKVVLIWIGNINISF